MSLTPEELELHRQLLAAFDEYIRTNLRWEQKGFRQDGRRTRKALRKIMNISYMRWQEVLYHMKDDSDEGMVIKEAGIDVTKTLHANASKVRKSISKEDDNTST